MSLISLATSYDPNSGRRLALDEDGHRTEVQDFDYNAIDEALGLHEPDAKVIQGWSPTKLKHASEALEEIIRWICNSGDIRGVALRALFLAQAVRPDLVPGCSMTGLARAYGVHKQSLGRFSKGFFQLSKKNFFHGCVKHNEETRRRMALAHVGQLNRKNRPRKMPQGAPEHV